MTILLTDEENPNKTTVEAVNKSYPNGIPKGYHVLYEAGLHDGFEEGAKAQTKKILEYLQKHFLNVTELEIAGKWLPSTKWQALKKEVEE